MTRLQPLFSHPQTINIKTFLLVLLLASILQVPISTAPPIRLVVEAWVPPTLTLAPPPTFGLASFLFPVRSAKVVTSSDLLLMEESKNKNNKNPAAPVVSSSSLLYQTELAKASDFFVDAFWTAKVGGGTNQLSDSQRKELQRSQLAEFRKRYGPNRLVQKSQFFMVRQQQQPRRDANAVNDAILACAGIELDAIRNGSVSSPVLLERSAPLMSNLAVARSYRRRGLAELLVQAVEDYVCETWPDQDACYLLVEARNRGAVKLYQKLGYQTLWSDDQAQTLLPQRSGELAMVPTVIVCMKKKLRKKRGKGIFSWFR